MGGEGGREEQEEREKDNILSQRGKFVYNIRASGMYKTKDLHCHSQSSTFHFLQNPATPPEAKYQLDREKYISQHTVSQQLHPT